MSWNGPRKIAAEDMRVGKGRARPGKTQYDKKTGAWRNRFENRKADPKRGGKNA